MILERSNCNRGMVDRERKRGKEIKKEVGVEMRKRDREKKCQRQIKKRDMFYGSGNKCQEIQGEGAEDRKRAINVYISCEMSDYRLYKLKAL